MPDELRQRTPRVRDHMFLRWLGTQPCCICGDNTTVEASHLRVGSINADKRETGGGERPSDRWAVPLCGQHHRESHSMNEMLFWTLYGLDPFALAMNYHMPRELDPLAKILEAKHGEKNEP